MKNGNNLLLRAVFAQSSNWRCSSLDRRGYAWSQPAPRWGSTMPACSASQGCACGSLGKRRPDRSSLRIRRESIQLASMFRLTETWETCDRPSISVRESWKHHCCKLMELVMVSWDIVQLNGKYHYNIMLYNVIYYDTLCHNLSDIEYNMILPVQCDI